MILTTRIAYNFCDLINKNELYSARKFMNRMNVTLQNIIIIIIF